MTRSANELEREAKLLGQQAASGQTSESRAIQILCALVEELAVLVDRNQRQAKQDADDAFLKLRQEIVNARRAVENKAQVQ